MKRIQRHSILILAMDLIGPVTAYAQMPVTRVVVAEARMVEARSTITLVGTVEPVRRSRVSSEIAGLAEQMPAREGDVIPIGGIICKLNDDTLALRLVAERAKLGALRSRHEELLAGTRRQELVRLKALLDAAVADEERWNFEMERVRKLYAGRDSNDKEFTDTRAGFIVAKLRKIVAEAAYNLGVEGPRKETIAQAAHEVAEQQAVVDRTASDLAKTVIRAPFAGHVVERTAEVGEWIAEGDAVVEMVDLSSVLVRVDAPESALPYLVVGDAVRVRVDALRRSFEGRIKHIMRQADRNARTFPLKIEVDNLDGLLAGGMFARATVPAGETNRIIAVSQDAIVERDGVTYVAMIMPGQQGSPVGILSPVTIGTDVDEWVTITSDNLEPGTLVITRGTERILPFPTPVEIVNEWGTPVAMPTGAQDRNRKGAADFPLDRPQELEGA